MRVIVAVLLFLACVQVGAHGGDGSGVSNGSGASEQAVIYSDQNFAELVEPCLRTDACGLIPEEFALLQVIVKANESGNLRFFSEAALPGRLFATESRVGAPILINRDRLWVQGSGSNQANYSLNDAVGLLTLAYAQHHAASEELGAGLAQKIARAALSDRLSYLPYLLSPNLRLLTMPRDAIELMIIDDGAEMFTRLDQLVVGQTGCEVVSLKSSSMHWTGEILPGEDPIQLTLNGEVEWTCRGPSTLVNRGEITVILTLEPTSESAADYWRDHRSSLRATGPNPVEVILTAITNE